MVVATVDTTACGLCLVLALFVRLRFQHDSGVAGATDGDISVPYHTPPPPPADGEKRLFDGTVRLSRPRPVSGANYIASPPLADGKTSLDSTSFSSVQFSSVQVAKCDAPVYLAWTLLRIIFFLRSLYYKLVKL